MQQVEFQFNSISFTDSQPAPANNIRPIPVHFDGMTKRPWAVQFLDLAVCALPGSERIAMPRHFYRTGARIFLNKPEVKTFSNKA
jgi:hypothetical protein